MKKNIFLYSLLAILCLIGCKDAKNHQVDDTLDEVGDENMMEDTEELEELTSFPIPYPKPSTIDVLPKNIINACKTLGEVDDTLSQALENCRYYRKSYFRVPEGFAMVTQLEQINKDGTSKLEEERWIYDTYARPMFSIADYVRRLFRAQPGYYRSIVFLISNKSFESIKEPLTREQAYDWLVDGGLKLPGYVREKAIDSEYSITALIYEFRKFENSKEAKLLNSSETQGRIHLQKSNILSNLK